MMPFTLERPATLRDALRADAEFIAGGTDMIQLMQEDVRRPSRLVDLTGVLPSGVLFRRDRAQIGAGTTMEEAATYAPLADAAPAVTEALLESASPQVRNLATMGGNLLQRTRCGYYRDSGVSECNKRRPGSGCAAIGGENRILAVLGTSEQCIATQPSDLAVALLALCAELDIAGPDGARHIPLAELHRTYADHPEIETTLKPGEVITAIEIPPDAAAANSVYLKVRDRASFEWALLSAAVGLEVQSGKISQARIAMGGVGTKPWRMANVEEALRGCPPEREAIAHAASLATEGARGWGHNDFKIAQMPRVLARAIELAAAKAGKAA
jgi:xanthine dehydrogenase YagS FAD-binding subunit